MLGCPGAQTKTFKKGEFTLEEGAPAKDVCILLTGCSHACGFHSQLIFIQKQLSPAQADPRITPCLHGRKP